MAKAKRQPYWWIYRDWGHIRARFGYYDIAIHHFDLASDTNPNDSSIKSSIAYMYWRQGLNDEARPLFEEALSLNNLHEYTLKYYSKFLIATGDTEYGESLRKKFYEVEENVLSTEPNEYDIEDDFDE